MLQAGLTTKAALCSSTHLSSSRSAACLSLKLEEPSDVQLCIRYCSVDRVTGSFLLTLSRRLRLMAARRRRFGVRMQSCTPAWGAWGRPCTTQRWGLNAHVQAVSLDYSGLHSCQAQHTGGVLKCAQLLLFSHQNSLTAILLAPCNMSRHFEHGWPIVNAGERSRCSAAAGRGAGAAAGSRGGSGWGRAAAGGRRGAGRRGRSFS